MSDPLKPLMKDGDAVFVEPWHAQVLALADTMVRAGKFSATDWAEALGTERREAEAAGQGDDPGIYYANALTALEKLCARTDMVSSAEFTQRRDAWEAAYRRTPHGKPVEL